MNPYHILLDFFYSNPLQFINDIIGSISRYNELHCSVDSCYIKIAFQSSSRNAYSLKHVCTKAVNHKEIDFARILLMKTTNFHAKHIRAYLLSLVIKI